MKILVKRKTKIFTNIIVYLILCLKKNMNDNNYYIHYIISDIIIFNYFFIKYTSKTYSYLATKLNLFQA